MKSPLSVILWAVIGSAITFTADASDISDADWNALLAKNTESAKSGVCYIHKIKMQKKMVPIHWGLPGPPGNDEPSTVERMQLFPFATEYSEGGCFPIPDKKTEEIYICKECQKAEAVWLEQRKKK